MDRAFFGHVAKLGVLIGRSRTLNDMIDPFITAFWKDEFSTYSDRLRAEAIGTRWLITPADLETFFAKLTELSGEQAAYIGVSTQGPFKAEHYRY